MRHLLSRAFLVYQLLTLHLVSATQVEENLDHLVAVNLEHQVEEVLEMLEVHQVFLIIQTLAMQVAVNQGLQVVEN
tara:strand:- start:76 stop:303 length:228 start_codon:yes stop_codon:yes gene_type:complete